jgi:hypothetical protein
MFVSSWYQSHPNNHSTEEPRFLGLPIRGQITISTSPFQLGNTSTIAMVFPLSKNLAPRCEQIYFILPFLK